MFVVGARLGPMIEGGKGELLFRLFIDFGREWQFKVQKASILLHDPVFRKKPALNPVSFGRTDLASVECLKSSMESCGGMGIRTPGLLIANETLYQLSYTPELFRPTPLKVEELNRFSTVGRSVSAAEFEEAAFSNERIFEQSEIDLWYTRRTRDREQTAKVANEKVHEQAFAFVQMCCDYYCPAPLVHASVTSI